jgi:hypothetical protein
MQLEAGIDMKVVQESLGHASITITADVYSHVMVRVRRGVADKYEAYREAAKDKPRTKRRADAVSYCTGPSSNGRTADFGSVNGGSNPPGPISITKS